MVYTLACRNRTSFARLPCAGDAALPCRFAPCKNGGRRRQAHAHCVKEEGNSERTRRLRDCFDVSAAVEELFTPDCSACASRPVQRRSWTLRFQSPQPTFSLNRIPLHASGWIQCAPPMKRNDVSVRQVWRCRIGEDVNPASSST